MIITQATAEDTGSIMKLAKLGETKLALDFGDKEEELKQHIRQEKGQVLIEKIADEVVAFLHKVSAGDKIFVEELYVSKQNRGNNIATQLLNKLPDKTIEFRVRADNKPMIAFAEKLGLPRIEKESDSESWLYRGKNNKNTNTGMNNALRKLTGRG